MPPPPALHKVKVLALLSLMRGQTEGPPFLRVDYSRRRDCSLRSFCGLLFAGEGARATLSRLAAIVVSQPAGHIVLELAVVAVDGGAQSGFGGTALA